MSDYEEDCEDDYEDDDMDIEDQEIEEKEAREIYESNKIEDDECDQIEEEDEPEPECKSDSDSDDDDEYEDEEESEEETEDIYTEGGSKSKGYYIDTASKVPPKAPDLEISPYYDFDPGRDIDILAGIIPAPTASNAIKTKTKTKTNPNSTGGFDDFIVDNVFDNGRYRIEMDWRGRDYTQRDPLDKTTAKIRNLPAESCFGEEYYCKLDWTRIEIFKYFRASERSDISWYKKQNILEYTYTAIDIQRLLSYGIIVYNSTKQEYYVFQRRKDFVAWYEPQYADIDSQQYAIPTYNECILGTFVQRLKFDLDMDASKVNEISEEIIAPKYLPNTPREYDAFGKLTWDSEHAIQMAKVNTIVDTLIDYIIYTLEEWDMSDYALDNTKRTWDADGKDIMEEMLKLGNYTRKNLIVANSNGIAGMGGTCKKKFSYHITTYNISVSGCQEAGLFTDRLIDNISEDWIKRFIDRGVNKSLQNFRIIYSHKMGEMRAKVPDDTFGCKISDNVADYFVNASQDQCWTTGLRAHYNPKTDNRIYDADIDVDHPMVKTILAKLKELKLMDGFSFNKVIHGSIITFKRTHPSHCQLCDRTHETENSLFVTVFKQGNYFVAIQQCRRIKTAKQYLGKYEMREIIKKVKRNSKGGEKPVSFAKQLKEIFYARGEHECIEIEKATPYVTKSMNDRLTDIIDSVNRIVEIQASPKSAPVEVDLNNIDTIDKNNRLINTHKLPTITAKTFNSFAVHAADLSKLKTKFEDFMTVKVPNHAIDCCDTKTVYSMNEMKPYEVSPTTLVVQAQMGLGKTKALKDYVSKNYLRSINSVMPAKIVIISFRTTFSSSIAQNFKQFVAYNDISGPINQNNPEHKNLIIQCESLHRLVISHDSAPDLLILDECESIFSQFGSGLHSQFNTAFAVFEFLFRYSKKVLLMDANITNRSYDMLKLMRPTHKIHFHWNQFKRAANDTFYFTTDPNAWMKKAFDCLEDGKKIVIATNSLAESKKYLLAFSTKFDKYNIGIYTSETKLSVKKEHFSNVNEYWMQYDILIYTPTCSAGVSFEQIHYDYLFGDFSNSSCDVETCRQMLGRVRNISSKETYIMLRNVPLYYPTTSEDIKAHLFNKKGNLYLEAKDMPMAFQYNERGDPRYVENTYFHLWVANTLITNLSRSNFLERFITQVKLSGAKVIKLDSIEKADKDSISLLLKNAKKQVILDHSNAVSTAPNASVDDVVKIIEKMHGQVEDVTDLESATTKKFFLKAKFDIDRDNPSAISPEFVQKYDNDSAKKVYDALKTVHTEPTVKEALEKLRLSELKRTELHIGDKKTTKAKDSVSYDLANETNGNNVYNKHLYCTRLLNMLGFTINATYKRTPAELRSDIVRTRKFMESFNKGCMSDFGTKAAFKNHIDPLLPDIEYNKKVLVTLNKFFSLTYGVSIKLRKKSEMYELANTCKGNLFKIVPYNPLSVVQEYRSNGQVDSESGSDSQSDSDVEMKPVTPEVKSEIPTKPKRGRKPGVNAKPKKPKVEPIDIQSKLQPLVKFDLSELFLRPKNFDIIS